MSDTHGTTHAAETPLGSAPAHGGDAQGGDVQGGDAQGGDAHGGHDAHGGGHGNVSEPLGPIGWAMWGAGALGVLVTLAMTVAFVYATGFSFSA